MRPLSLFLLGSAIACSSVDTSSHAVTWTSYSETEFSFSGIYIGGGYSDSFTSPNGLWTITLELVDTSAGVLYEPWVEKNGNWFANSWPSISGSWMDWPAEIISPEGHQLQSFEAGLYSGWSGELTSEVLGTGEDVDGFPLWTFALNISARGPGTNVPDAGSTSALLGLAFLGLMGLFRGCSSAPIR